MKGLSIIIPCYKRKKELKECLQSISKSEGLGKDFNYEIIIVENSPKKELEKVVLEFRNLNVRYFWTKRMGVSVSRNYGAKKARYDILCFCDSDIILKERTLLETYLTFTNNPYASLVSGKVFWYKTNKLDRPSATDRFFNFKKISFAECFYGRFIACQKSCFFKAGCYDAYLFNARGEGVDLSIRFWRAGYPLVFNPKIAVFHRKHAEASISRDNNKGNTEMLNSIMLLLYKYQDNEKTKNNTRYHPISLYNWTKGLFGKMTPFIILEAWSDSLGWLFRKYRKIINSRINVPSKYDFKPFEVLSNKKLLVRCIREFPKRNLHV